MKWVLEIRIKWQGLSQNSTRGMDEELENDRSQKLRWEAFMETESPAQMESDFSLLKAMELLEELGQITLDGAQAQGLLEKDTMDRITVLRGSQPRMGACDNKRKSKEEALGPILVERH
jgi:hypothetical protein